MISHSDHFYCRPAMRQGRRVFLAAACGLGTVLDRAHAAHRPRQRNGRAAGAQLRTEDRVAFALMRFREGYHCSQSLLEAYADDIGIEPELARRLAAALAGGSGTGGECGVVGSAYIVLGAKYAGYLPSHGDTRREEELWSRVRNFLKEFRSRHGAITCRELLGFDVFTEEGRQEALRLDLFVKRCQGHIRSGIEILDALDR